MRNPTFGRDSRNTNTFQNGANCASNYGGRPNSYHSQKLGSYRVSHYDAFKIPSDFLSTNPAWKEITPMSINLREETFHLSPVEQRVEDYYLIQKLMLEEKHKKHLQTCV